MLYDGLLITILSSVFIAAFISCVLAAVITTDSGIPCPSVSTCRFVPNLPLSVGLGPISHFPPKGAFIDTLSRDWHFHWIPTTSSYNFSILAHNFWNTLDEDHCWNRLWQVDPEPYSLGSIFHWHPVLNTNRIPSNTFLNDTAGRPIVLFGFSDGSIKLISFHNGSGILLTVGRYLTLS